MRNLRGFVGSVVKKPGGPREPEVVIRLTSSRTKIQNEVCYDFNSGIYQLVVEEDPTLDILTLPSRSVHRDVATPKDLNPPAKQNETPKEDEENDESKADLDDDLCSTVVSKEELKRIDSQPNPFNFSDRVSQTVKIPRKDTAMQTEPAPSTTFSVNVGLCDIYEAYRIDYLRVLEIERELEKEKEREREKERSANKVKQVTDPIKLPPKPKPTRESELNGLRASFTVLERMITQNTFDDILQDFGYWEDASDEYRAMEGSLLPLWKFHHDKSRVLLVSAVCWSPVYHDLFAAAYTAAEATDGDGEGMLCFYSLKNPCTPERVLRTPSGVTSLHLHPQYCSVLGAGFVDGSVAMYDVSSPSAPTVISSSSLGGKHLLPVTQVRWVRTQAGEDLSFFSTALDGRVTQWHLHNSSLIHLDILNFKSGDQPATPVPVSDKVTLEGLATCIAFRPDDERVILIGVDTGALFQCSTNCSLHTLVRYPAHTSPVRGLAWNGYHNRIFLSCSVDWTVKVWLQYKMSPLVTLDLGAAVAAVTWSPYSSSVFVAVTDEGRVYVYDLFLRKCKPLCVQTLLQRRRVVAACVAFNPFHPIILVGGEKGYLVSLKLSPNLRRPPKDSKGSDPQQLKEIELCKMERLIATSNKG